MKQINPSFKAKLKNYSILASSMLAVEAVNGQIVHHNLNAEILSRSAFPLDLNGDGTNDFYFNLSKFKNGANIELYQGNISFASFGSNQSVAGATHPDSGYPFLDPYAYSAGKLISSKNKFWNAKEMVWQYNGHSTVWYPDLGQFSTKSGNTAGNFAGKTAFLSLRVNSGGKSYYGWARIALSPKVDTMTIFDYAYQSIPDSSIIAGDTDVATNIVNHDLSNAEIFSAGKRIHVRYKAAQQDGMTIVIRDISGKEISSVQTQDADYTHELNEAPEGIYEITVTSGDRKITKKVSIM